MNEAFIAIIVRNDSACRPRSSAWAARFRPVWFGRLVRFAARDTSYAGAQPGREVALSELAFGEGKILPEQLEIVGPERRAVQLDERFAAHRGGALVAVNERMIAREPVRKRRRQIGEIRRRITVGVQLLGSAERRFEQSFIAHAGAPAVLGDLAVVNGEDERLSQPDDHRRLSALRELAQQRAALAHHPLGGFHLAGELRIERGELDAVGKLRSVERVALLDAKAREQLPGQDDAGGIANGGDLDFHGATSACHYNVCYIPVRARVLLRPGKDKGL